jgi:probable phosphoglycerate mutase
VPESAPAWAPPTGRPTRLVLVRHGSTIHSAERRFSGRNYLPLNDVGVVQAAALAKRSYGRIDAVVSSPLRRAVQTAEAIAAPLGLAVQIEPDLIETDFGAWEGRTFAEVRGDDPDALTAWRASLDAAPPGGESFASVGRRVQRARAALIAAHPGSHVAVISHVTPIKSLVRFALDAPPVAMFRLHLDPASVSIVDYHGNGDASVRLVNDTSHLG